MREERKRERMREEREKERERGKGNKLSYPRARIGGYVPRR